MVVTSEVHRQSVKNVDSQYFKICSSTCNQSYNAKYFISSLKLYLSIKMYLIFDFNTMLTCFLNSKVVLI